MKKATHAIRLKETAGFRDVRFDSYDEAMQFKVMAEEDGTYWGYCCESCDGHGTPAGEAAGLICGSCMGSGIESDKEID